jgi:hypothetical protein
MNMIGFNNGQKRNIQTKRYYWVRAGRIQHKIKEFLKFIKNDENQPPHNIIVHLIDIWVFATLLSFVLFYYVV